MPRPVPARPRPGRPAGAPLIRQRILKQALSVLARDGINGGSLRSIVRASGAANPSALHYHFGSRTALVQEIGTLLQQQFEPQALERLNQLEARGSYTVREVLSAAFGPLLEMLVQPDYGPDAIRFIARLGWDFGIEGQRLSGQMHERTLSLAHRLLRPLLPHLDEEALKFKLIMNMNNVYHGLADRSYLRRSPFGALKLAERDNVRQLTTHFMDYLEGGLRYVAR